MGFTAGVAGLLYMGVGRLPEVRGLDAAMALSYAALIPAAALAWYALRAERVEPGLSAWLRLPRGCAFGAWTQSSSPFRSVPAARQAVSDAR